VPYPSACRPQAWAAALSSALVTALLGLDVDVPARRVALSPLPGFRDLSVDNVRIGSAALSVRVDSDGTVSTGGGPPGVTVI
jgi:glycogen debranching enzyme